MFGKSVLGIVVAVLVLTAAGCDALVGVPSPVASPASPVFPPPTVTHPISVPPSPVSPISPPPTPPVSVLASPPALGEAAGYLGVAQRGGALGAVWTLADIRTADYADHVRLVWEMAGAGETGPYFEVVEVDNVAVPFPTGADLSWGAARIDLVVSDLYAREFGLDERLPIVPAANPLVTRVDVYPTYSDSQLGFSVGLRTPAAYQVFELTEPTRIVIDVFYLQ